MKLIAAAWILTGGALAQGPENVLIVENRSSTLSGQIARYYAARRSVPLHNVCTIRVTPDEEISRSVYESHVASPIAECLKSRGLQESILYLVTTAGVPLKISGSGRGLDTDAASVDSELCLLYEMRKAPRSPKGPAPNPFYRQRDAPFRHPRFPIYLVTRLAAYDLNGAKALIDRALRASNRGKFVLDLEGADDRQGNDWLRTAAILLPEDRVVLDESERVLSGERDVIGYASWGSNDSRRKQRFLGFQWLPGAIVSEYVSTNGRTFRRPPDSWKPTLWNDKAGWFAGSPQGLAADYIEEGASGASAHAYEPYLQFTPRPDYLFPAYLSGRNLAESYYLSIPALSWQNVLIGDPLCSLKPPR